MQEWHHGGLALEHWARRLVAAARGSATLLAARADGVKTALEQSIRLAAAQIERDFHELDVRVIAMEVARLLAECLAILLATTGVGAALGGLAGFFGGAGVGAVPGAIEGATLGAEAGQWLLAALGLKALAEFVVKGLPAIGRAYWTGLRDAWLATRPDALPWGRPHVSKFAIDGAAHTLARAHVAMFVLLLTAIVAYLSKGRSMGELAESASKGRLGSKFGEWLLKNEDKLKADPRVRPIKPLRREPPTAANDAPTGRAPPRQEPKAEPESTVPTRMPRKKAPCFKTQKLPSGKFAEMDRQLAGQQRALNKMTVQDYLDGRARYAADGRKGAAQAALQARADHQAEWIDDLTDMHLESGLDRGTAESQAADQVTAFMRTQDALHAPDMIAGGKPDDIDGMGDAQVNRTIGRQWNRGAEAGMTRVGHLDAAALAVPEDARTTTLMNVELHRCQ